MAKTQFIFGLFGPDLNYYQLSTYSASTKMFQILTKALFWILEKKQTNAICIGGSVSTSHDVFFTHLEAIENLINIEFPAVSWQSTGSFIT